MDEGAPLEFPCLTRDAPSHSTALRLRVADVVRVDGVVVGLVVELEEGVGGVAQGAAERERRRDTQAQALNQSEFTVIYEYPLIIEDFYVYYFSDNRRNMAHNLIMSDSS